MARSPRAVAFVGLVIAAALLDVAPRASADVAASSGNVDQYHYIVESGVGPGTSENLAPPRTPVGHVAPLGFFWVYPVGTSFTFSIDDFGAPGGVQGPRLDGELFRRLHARSIAHDDPRCVARCWGSGSDRIHRERPSLFRNGRDRHRYRGTVSVVLITGMWPYL